MIEGSSDLWIRILIQEAEKHTDPTDPDPQHWFHNTGVTAVLELALELALVSKEKLDFDQG